MVVSLVESLLVISVKSIDRVGRTADMFVFQTLGCERQYEMYCACLSSLETEFQSYLYPKYPKYSVFAVLELV
jgi:hypothetical protein